MKEEYGWYYSKEAEKIENELKSTINGKGKVHRQLYGFYIDHKHFGSWRYWIAKINFEDKEIRVANEKLYSLLKEFGEKHNFNILIKEYDENSVNR